MRSFGGTGRLLVGPGERRPSLVYLDGIRAESFE
jgi:hypothetical protein